MKLEIITPYYTPIMGGITTYVRELYRELQECGIEASLTTLNGDAHEGVMSTNGVSLLKLWGIFLHLKKSQPNVVHIHGHWKPLLPAILYRVLNKKTKLLFTFHTEPVEWLSGVRRTVFRFFLSFCDDITFVSKALRNEIMSDLNVRTNATIIYPGVKHIMYDELQINAFVKKFSLSNRHPIITFIGSLEWQKKVAGVKILVRSIKQIININPKALLMIVGDGRYRKELETLIENEHLVENCVITGFAEDVGAPLYYTNIYAHISLQEGMPIALLEAMSLGKPVIATNVGGIGEIITNNVNGVLVEANEDKIALAILNLLDNSEIAQSLGKAAEKTVTDGFKWSNTARQFIDLYKRE